MTTYLLLPELVIHDANAMSSTLTLGFPAMTAWLGAVHALQRRLVQQDVFANLSFSKVAVSCLDTALQVYQGPGDYVQSIINTKNPGKLKGKEVQSSSFIETGRIHLTVSLLIEMTPAYPGDLGEAFLTAVQQVIPRMKMAGGDIISMKKPKLLYADAEEPQSSRKVILELMPGYVIIERTDLLKERQDKANPLENLLSYLSVHVQMKAEIRTYRRQAPGWLLPLAIGFRGISPVGHVANQRDVQVPHQFAESVITLGEFRMAHRFQNIDEMMWHYEYNAENSLYLCKNQEV